jgi:Trypsin-co-occurring domain 1
MVGRLGRIRLDDGTWIYVETRPTGPGPIPAGRADDVVEELGHTFQQMMDSVAEVARTAVGGLRRAGPAEIVVNFEVTLGLAAGVVLTKATVGGDMSIQLTWRNDGTKALDPHEGPKTEP